MRLAASKGCKIVIKSFKQQLGQEKLSSLAFLNYCYKLENKLQDMKKQKNPLNDSMEVELKIDVNQN